MMKHIPQRMCVACRNMTNQSDLIRIVKNNVSGTVETDLEKKKFGRGAYVCKNEKCINLAKKKRAVERHMKTEIPQDFYDELIKIAEAHS